MHRFPPKPGRCGRSQSQLNPRLECHLWQPIISSKDLEIMVLEVIYVVRHGVSTSLSNYGFEWRNASAPLNPFHQYPSPDDEKHWIILLVVLDLHILTTNVVSLKLGCQSRNRCLHWQRSKPNRNSIRPSPLKLRRKASRRIDKSYLDITTSN